MDRKRERWTMKNKGKDRKTERERGKERQTEGKTDKQRKTWIDKQWEGITDRQRDIQRGKTGKERYIDNIYTRRTKYLRSLI